MTWGKRSAERSLYMVQAGRQLASSTFSFKSSQITTTRKKVKYRLMIRAYPNTAQWQYFSAAIIDKITHDTMLMANHSFKAPWDSWIQTLGQAKTRRKASEAPPIPGSQHPLNQVVHQFDDRFFEWKFKRDGSFRCHILFFWKKVATILPFRCRLSACLFLSRLISSTNQVNVSLFCAGWMVCGYPGKCPELQGVLTSHLRGFHELVLKIGVKLRPATCCDA